MAQGAPKRSGMFKTLVIACALVPRKSYLRPISIDGGYFEQEAGRYFRNTPQQA